MSRFGSMGEDACRVGRILKAGEDRKISSLAMRRRAARNLTTLRNLANGLCNLLLLKKQRKELTASQKSPTKAPSARTAEF